MVGNISELRWRKRMIVVSGCSAKGRIEREANVYKGTVDMCAVDESGLDEWTVRSIKKSLHVGHEGRTYGKVKLDGRRGEFINIGPCTEPCYARIYSTRTDLFYGSVAAD